MEWGDVIFFGVLAFAAWSLYSDDGGGSFLDPLTQLLPSPVPASPGVPRVPSSGGGTAATASAPPTTVNASWGLSSGWDQASTDLTRAVHDALSRGLAGDDAIAWLQGQGLPAVSVPAGSASPFATITWYGKGEGLSGKFQCPDGDPIVNGIPGWVASWDPSSYVDGPAPAGWPVGPDGKHPTAWRLQAE